MQCKCLLLHREHRNLRIKSCGITFCLLESQKNVKNTLRIANGNNQVQTLKKKLNFIKSNVQK